jgi:tRNA(adenine34) deaminase
MDKYEQWMKIAIQQANLAKELGEVPVGAVIIKNDIIISKGHNEPISKNDPTAHAEIQAIRSAGKILKNYRITGSSIFVTLEPCIMCFGAILNARVEKIFFGAYDEKKGICSSCNNYLNKESYKNSLKIRGGILENQCSMILKKFFKERR